MKTFLDSGVLLHAWRGETLSGAAMQIMDDETREFFTSQMVRLELLPKARFEKRPKEVAFYEAHFADCAGSQPLSQELGLEAEKLAARHGLAGPGRAANCRRHPPRRGGVLYFRKAWQTDVSGQ